MQSGWFLYDHYTPHDSKHQRCKTGNGGKVRTLHGSGACSTQDIFFTCSYKYSSYAQYFQLFPYMSKTTQIIITTCNILQKSRLYIFGLNPILQKMKCNAGYLRQYCLIRRQCWTNMQIVCPQIHKILPLLDSFWSKTLKITRYPCKTPPPPIKTLSHWIEGNLRWLILISKKLVVTEMWGVCIYETENI